MTGEAVVACDRHAVYACVICQPGALEDLGATVRTPVRISAGHRRFQLERDTDVTGVSGTGVVAEGVEFSDGVVALRWTSAYPTSVVFHDRGMESVEAVHGHGGSTRIVYLDR